MQVRGDTLPYHTNIDATMLTRASKLVSAVSSFPVQYNKAIVGRNAFAHESGIHQDGMLKNARTYEIMVPESVGVSKTSLVMGKHSGRHAFKEKLKELGYELGDNALEDAFTRFKDLADRKKIVYDEDLVALVDDEIVNAHDRIKLVALTVIAGTKGPQSAALTLDIDGEQKTHQATGNGPVDAIFNAIVAFVPHTAVLELYQVHAVTKGNRRAGRSVGPPCRGWQIGHRQRRRSRYFGGLGQGLYRVLEQAHGQTRKIASGRPDRLTGALVCGRGRCGSALKAGQSGPRLLHARMTFLSAGLAALEAKPLRWAYSSVGRAADS